MLISALLKNDSGSNEITVITDNSEKKIHIPGKPGGGGSLVNGGELLFLSLATCFCNDMYREAAKRKIILQTVEVKVTGKFEKEGQPASHIMYEVKVASPSDDKEISDLISYVDKIAEVHNTLRTGMNVTLKGYNINDDIA